jgi:hypothetical protein
VRHIVDDVISIDDLQQQLAAGLERTVEPPEDIQVRVIVEISE